MKIAIKTIFRNHVYKFTDKIYQQIGGGPTGFRSTGSAAEIRMGRWARKLKKVLRDSGIEWELFIVYVDDVRLGLRALKKGMVYCKICKTVVFSLEQFRADNKSRETDSQRTARILRDAMNDLEPDLSFTTETEEDFESSTLPTLDFQCWVKTKVASPPTPHSPPTPLNSPPNSGGTLSSWEKGLAAGEEEYPEASRVSPILPPPTPPPAPSPRPLQARQVEANREKQTSRQTTS